MRRCYSQMATPSIMVLQIPAAEANGSVSLRITAEAAAAKTFYIDAIQCRAGYYMDDLFGR